MPKKPALRKTERFHRNKGSISGVILSQMDPRETIFGAQAINLRVPLFLNVPTSDIDIMTTMPRKDAREVELALDRRFKGNFFKVVQARDPDTRRVKSLVDGRFVADFRKTDKPIKSTLIRGVNVATLPELKRLAKLSLNNPLAVFRREKDRDALNRLKIAQKIIKENSLSNQIKRGLRGL